MSVERSLPGFFHSGESRLFGCLAEPSAPSTGRVVLCYPLVHEYVNAHRAFRRLATLLSREGHRVLRFDYYGTGDSEGDFVDADLDRWLEDLSAAVGKVREADGGGEVALVGLRLGANLAAELAASDSRVGRLVLWDPLVDGRECVQALARQGVASDAGLHVHGYLLPEPLLEELARVRLPSSGGSSGVARALVLSGVERIEDACAPLGAWISHVDRAVLSEDVDWSEDANRMNVPARILQEIVHWISKQR